MHGQQMCVRMAGTLVKGCQEAAAFAMAVLPRSLLAKPNMHQQLKAPPAFPHALGTLLLWHRPWSSKA
jgi:hypothetical protein